MEAPNVHAVFHIFKAVRQVFLISGLLLILLFQGPSLRAQCPLQSSFESWQKLEDRYPAIARAEKDKDWEKLAALAQTSLDNAPAEKGVRTFLRYHLAHGLIQSGRGAEAVPILTDSTLSSFNPEAGLEYFHIMISKLGLNFLGRFADPKLALKHLDGLKPWMRLGECDSLIDLMRIYRNAGELYHYRMESNILAEDYFNKAFTYWSENALDSSLLPPLLYNLAVIKNLSNQHEIALDYVNSAVRIARKYPEKFAPNFLMSCMNITGAIYYNWHKYDRFVETMEELVALREKDTDPYKYDHLMGEYWNLATGYRENCEYGKAERELKKLLALSGRTREYSDPAIAVNYYNDLILLRTLQGDLDSAAALVRLNEALLQGMAQPYGYAHFFFDKYRTGLLARKGDYARAIGILDVVLNKPGRDKLEFFLANPLLHAELYVKAGDYRRFRFSKGGGRSDLERCLGNYRLADSVLHVVRTSNPWRPSSQEIAEHYRDLYEKILTALSDMYRLEPEPAYLADAFDIMERNKALLMNEARERNRYTSFAGLGEDTIRKIQDLESEIVSMSMAVRAGGGQEDKIKLDRAQTGYTDLLKGISSGYIDRVRLTPLDEWRVQCKKQGRAWIQYFMGDSLLFILGSDGKRLDFSTVELTVGVMASLDIAIAQPRSFGKAENFTAYTRSMRGLYDMLIPASIRQNKRPGDVIIMPDGPLYFLTFEALLTSDELPAGVNYRDLPYWIQDVSISYGMSASTWEKAGVPRGGRLISTRYGGEDMELPASGRESKALAAIWTGEWLDITGKPDFFKHAGGAAILHFAAHAMAGLEDGKENRILLCESFASPACTIEGYELLGLQLDGKMVILNACETSYGLEKKGEGIYSMSRDFAMAGVSSIVSNLWKVEDNAASELIISMMKNWKGEKDLSRALAKAKRRMIAEGGPEGAHPFFWAGTIIIGDGRLEGGSWLKPIHGIGAAALALVMAGIGWRRRRKGKAN